MAHNLTCSCNTTDCVLFNTAVQDPPVSDPAAKDREIGQAVGDDVEIQVSGGEHCTIPQKENPSSSESNRECLS